MKFRRYDRYIDLYFRGDQKQIMHIHVLSFLYVRQGSVFQLLDPSEQSLNVSVHDTEQHRQT